MDNSTRIVQDVGFRGLGFIGIGFRGLGFIDIGFRDLGFRGIGVRVWGLAWVCFNTYGRICLELRSAPANSHSSMRAIIYILLTGSYLGDYTGEYYRG